jgi:PAS domain S-box-containing protein
MNPTEQVIRLIDVMPDAAFINVDDRITHCNPALHRLVGVTGEAGLIGRSPLSVFHPRYHDIIRRRIEEMRAQRGAAPMIEEEVVHLAHGTIPVEVVATSFSHEGQPAVLVVLRDLRRSRDLEARFRLLVDAVTDYAIYTLDAAGLIATWNDGAMRLYGYTQAEVLGQPHGILFGAETSPRARPRAPLATALAGGSAADLPCVRKDGSRFWGKVVITALRDSAGRPLRVRDRRARPDRTPGERRALPGPVRVHRRSAVRLRLRDARISRGERRGGRTVWLQP